VSPTEPAPGPDAPIVAPEAAVPSEAVVDLKPEQGAVLTASVREAIQSHASVTVSEALRGAIEPGYADPDLTSALAPDAHAYLVEQVSHSGLGPLKDETVADYLRRIADAPYAGGTHLYRNAAGLPVIYGGDFGAQQTIAYEYLLTAKPGSSVLLPGPDGKGTWRMALTPTGAQFEPAAADGTSLADAIKGRGFFGRILNSLGLTPDAAPPIDPQTLTRVR
jgi:hypothetical protein